MIWSSNYHLKLLWLAKSSLTALKFLLILNISDDNTLLFIDFKSRGVGVFGFDLLIKLCENIFIHEEFQSKLQSDTNLTINMFGEEIQKRKIFHNSYVRDQFFLNSTGHSLKNFKSYTLILTSNFIINIYDTQILVLQT